jgi:hypothetical protein
MLVVEAAALGQLLLAQAILEVQAVLVLAATGVLLLQIQQVHQRPEQQIKAVAVAVEHPQI